MWPINDEYCVIPKMKRLWIQTDTGVMTFLFNFSERMGNKKEVLN